MTEKKSEAALTRLNRMNNDLGLKFEDLIPDLTTLETILAAEMIEDMLDRRGKEWVRSHLPIIRNQIVVMTETL